MLRHQLPEIVLKPGVLRNKIVKTGCVGLVYKMTHRFHCGNGERCVVFIRRTNMFCKSSELCANLADGCI